MVVVAGEALIDLAPRDGLLLPLPGGSPYNVAVGLARLGSDARFLGPLSTDGFGRQLADRLRAEGADLDLAPRTGAPTTLAVVHLDDQGRASYGFYLDGTSAVGLAEGDLPDLPDGAALHVSFGAVTMDTVPAGPALVRLLARNHAGGVTSLDPNVRPTVIADMDAYAARLDEVVAGVDLVKVSDEDLGVLRPGRDPMAVGADWAAIGPALVVVTRGPDGAVALRPGREAVEVRGHAVAVVDTVGAGDAFTSGLLAWLDQHGQLRPGGLAALTDREVEDALERAVLTAALTCTRAGSDPPRTEEL